MLTNTLCITEVGQTLQAHNMHKIHIQQEKLVRDADPTGEKAWNTQSMFKQKFHALQKEESLKWRISDDFYLKNNFFL